MKRVLVAVADYPNDNGNTAMMFVHTRNKYYRQHGIEVTVLNFKTQHKYIFEGIEVISLSEYSSCAGKYDILIMHAPNIRNHYLFLKQNAKLFQRLIFFFHGHEILKVNKVYPEPYDYLKKHSMVKVAIQNIYDCCKLYLWRKYFPKIAFKSDFIFVSNSLFEEFKQYTKLSTESIDNHINIINNSVGNIFENRDYNINSQKAYDFITIRSDMDSSVYCIDLLCELANKFPQKNFLLIGRGRWFQYNAKPKNITWINATLSHEELLAYIDKAKCAIMLTRRDTQGVMSCELVTYGIPLITSDLKICREMFGTVKNVKLISNKIEKIDLDQIVIGLYSKRMDGVQKVDKFNYFNTVFREEELIKRAEANI